MSGLAAQPVDVRTVMAGIEREIHERWCGSPATCGLARDCEGAANADEMRVVRKHLRTALKSRPADPPTDQRRNVPTKP